jgi:glycosyltransferase involved in cell wall biosynthesis
MRIAIIGTRGIPNHYGGFEQCAEYLSAGLVKKGYEVVVYNSHNHPYQKKEWNGVEIRHCYDPEYKMGTAGQFFYDFNCINDLRDKHFDVVLQLGYTSSSVWGWLLPKHAIVTTNMDGMEWNRDKYTKKTKAFLRVAERLAVLTSDHLIADSIEIQRYYNNKYGKKPTYIPYGASLFEDNNPSFLEEFNVSPFQYSLLIARMEPENSIEMILDGYALIETAHKFLVIGDTNNKFGKYLVNKFKNKPGIVFCGGVYCMEKLNNLRYYSNLYFHGHTVGGTNPSLLEAMASNALICANDNVFNRAVLNGNAHYFATAIDVANNLLTVDKTTGEYNHMLVINKKKIKNVYSIENIVNSYANHFERIVRERFVERPQNILESQIKLQLKNN